MAKRPPPDSTDLTPTGPRGSLVERLTQAVTKRVVDGIELCLDCDLPATRMDGCCAEHTSYGRTAGELKAMAAERVALGALKSARNRELGETVAALKGDTRPAEWNLTHGTKTIEPIKDAGPAGIIVQVGVILPGLPGSE